MTSLHPLCTLLTGPTFSFPRPSGSSPSPAPDSVSGNNRDKQTQLDANDDVTCWNWCQKWNNTRKKIPRGKSSGCSTVHRRSQMANTFGAFPLAPTRLHSVCYFSTDSSRVPSEPNQTKIVTVDRVDGSCDSFTKSNPAFKEKNKSERAFSFWAQQTIEMASERVARLNDEVKTFLRLGRTNKSNGGTRNQVSPVSQVMAAHRTSRH